MRLRGEQAAALAIAAVLVLAVLLASRGSGPPARVGAPLAQTATPSSGPATQLRSPAPQAISAAPTSAPASQAPASRQVAGPFPPAPPRTGCPPPPLPPSGPGPRPRPLQAAVPEAKLPQPLPPAAKAATLAAVRGKGVWVTPMSGAAVDVARVIAQVRRLDVRSLWIRTGGSRQGYYGDRFLPRLVPAAHAAGLTVVAWDFADLSSPVVDAARARQALAAGVDAFSPDIETAAERAFPTARRIALYLSLVRQAAGSRPVIATVPRPTDLRLRSYPYRAFTAYADGFAPMVYWSCNEPGAVVQQSLTRLGRMLPVLPIGQGYDMRSEGGRAGTPSRTETLRFLDAARRGGAPGASLWTLEDAGAAQLQALADYRWPVLTGR